jgi:hypothetical protein
VFVANANGARLSKVDQPIASLISSDLARRLFARIPRKPANPQTIQHGILPLSRSNESNTAVLGRCDPGQSTSEAQVHRSVAVLKFQSGSAADRGIDIVALEIAVNQSAIYLREHEAAVGWTCRGIMIG